MGIHGDDVKNIYGFYRGRNAADNGMTSDFR